jgi:hypothetical protein
VYFVLVATPKIRVSSDPYVWRSPLHTVERGARRAG